MRVRALLSHYGMDMKSTLRGFIGVPGQRVGVGHNSGLFRMSLALILSFDKFVKVLLIYLKLHGKVT